MTKKMLNRHLPLLLFIATYSYAGLGENVVQGLAGASEFMLGLFYLTGIAFIFTGVNKLKKLGHRTAFMNVDSGVTGPLIMLVLGALLIFFPSFLTVLNTSLFGKPEIAELAYDQGGDTLLDKIGPMVVVIQLIGLIAILRGFLILTKVTGQGAQPGTISKGFIHIFGGVMAVNIVDTITIMVKTFGYETLGSGF